MAVCEPENPILNLQQFSMLYADFFKDMYLGSLSFAGFDVEIHQSTLYYYSYALNTDLRVVSQITSIPTAAQFPISLNDGVFASPI